MVASRAESCAFITHGQPLQAVKACVDAREMTLITPRWKRSYGKQALHRVLTDLYTQFATNERFRRHGLEGTLAEIWADVALTDPSDVRFTILFRVKGGFVLQREPLDENLWTLDPPSLVFIPGSDYPSRNARRTGLLQLVPQNDVAPRHVEKILMESGVALKDGRASLISGTWPNLLLRTKPFDEAETAATIARHPRAHLVLADIFFVPAGEREGAKYRLLTFPLAVKKWGL